MILNPIGHSVGQFFNVPSAVQGQERLHSSTCNQAGAFLFQDFSKKAGSNDFLVSLYSPIIFTSVPGREKSTHPRLDRKPRRAKNLAAVHNRDRRTRRLSTSLIFVNCPAASSTSLLQ
jgi:hypothetical protein